MQKTTKPKNAFTLITNERKWWQPWFWLHLITKSCDSRELGLPTSSAAVHLRKMMQRTMFWSIQILCEWQIYLMFPLYCAQILSFNYFHLLTSVSSVILVLQVCALILGYAVHIFWITDTKCIMFGVGRLKSLKDSATPERGTGLQMSTLEREKYLKHHFPEDWGGGGGGGGHNLFDAV